MSQLNLNIPAKAGAHQLRGRKASLQKPEECVMTNTLRTGVMMPSTHMRGLGSSQTHTLQSRGKFNFGTVYCWREAIYFVNYLNKEETQETREMAEWTKQVLHKREDWGSDPRTMKELGVRTRAMSQCLGALLALAEDLGFIHRTHMVAHNHL